MQTVNSSKSSDFISLLNILAEFNNNDWENRLEIQESLTSSPSPVIVLQALNFLFSPEVLKQFVSPEELEISFGGREVAWTWFKEKWGNLDEDMTRYFNNILYQFASTERAAEIKDFFAHQQLSPSGKIYLRNCIDQILMRAQWVKDIQKERNLPSLIKKLSPEIC
ncbi:hypothetical protein QQ045_028919 [Rhodiola kirilowii]